MWRVDRPPLSRGASLTESLTRDGGLPARDSGAPGGIGAAIAAPRRQRTELQSTGRGGCRSGKSVDELAAAAVLGWCIRRSPPNR